jgi:TolB-like protein/Flp pilus assembly protein TadD
MADHRWDDALQELAQVPETFLFDRAYHGPKALLAGLAHQRAGRPEAAAAQFREAERLLREHLAADSDNEELHLVLAVALACAGRGSDARSELGLVEPLVKGRLPSIYRGSLVMTIAQTYAVLGDYSQLAPWLRKLFAEPSQFPFTPASLRLDPRFAAAVEAPEIQSLLREFSGLDVPVVLVPAPPAVADTKSVAVLAFANLSDDKGNEYFSDGISEELLNVLVKVPGLKVTARTSAFSFKGKEVPIPEIARQLGVAYIVEGSVRKQGDKVRITAQLIKAADGFHLWSDTFTRELKDIFAVQDEIAGLIAQQLQLKLGDAQRSDRVVNPEAHQLYLQGKFFLNQFSFESAAKAAGLLQRAVQLDPQFAPAWAALSRAGSVQGGYADTRSDFEAGYRLAREAANRALVLDPNLAAAHLAKADVQSGNDFDWKGASESMRRAEALAPNDPAVVDGSARLAYYLGQREKAVELSRQAAELDPVNPAVRAYRGFALLSVRRFEEAETEFRRVAELNPVAPWGHAGVSQSLAMHGRFDEAAAEAGREFEGWSRDFALAIAQWGQKKTTEADATLARLIKSDADVAAYQIAEVYAFRQDKDRAFEWLERAYRQRDSGLAWAKSDLSLDGLHGDPRWDGFLHKLGLADDQLK